MATQPPRLEENHKSKKITYEARAMNGRDVRGTFDDPKNLDNFIRDRLEKNVKLRVFKIETQITELKL